MKNCIFFTSNYRIGERNALY